MAFTIAVAGKGGVGKTSFCALLVRWLIQKGETPILAVDADPNSNLAEALGVDVTGGTIADIISQTKEIDGIPTNMSQDEFISYKLNASLTEADNFDLVAMGGPEGPGCYCFPNNVLKKHLSRLSQNYKTVVLDNEAGLEHISRGTTVDNVDALFILSDTSLRSVRSAGRVYELTKELKVPVHNVYLILTRTREGDSPQLEAEVQKIGLPVAGRMPEDAQLTEYELAGRPLYELPADAAVVAAANEILDTTIGGMLPCRT